MKETPIGITIDGNLIKMVEPTNAELLAALGATPETPRSAKEDEE